MRWIPPAALRIVVPVAESSSRSSDKRQVRAALGRHERVDLVDDDRVDRAQRLARVRRQEQVERLRRGDQDVGGLAQEPGALDRRRVAGADGDRRLVIRVAARDRPVRDAGERRPQVSLDVDRQRLQRRDVEHAAAVVLRRHRVEHQPVDAPEKRGQRLAAAGRREDQRGVAPRDGRPALGPAAEWAPRTSRGTSRRRPAERGRAGRFVVPQSLFFSGCVDRRRRTGQQWMATVAAERGHKAPRHSSNVRPRDRLRRWRRNRERGSQHLLMGDSGEGLVDAEARIQEQIEEREAERQRRGSGGPKIDPERVRELESLRLAKSNLEQQAESTEHPVRKQQIKLAIAEIDKRLALKR